MKVYDVLDMASGRKAEGRRGKEEEGEEDGARGGAGASGEEKFTFFFGAASPFSQWHPAEFEVDDVTYNCAEQYMMHQKAGEPLTALM